MPHKTGRREKHKGLAEAKPLINLVSVRGFEPPTPSSRTRLQHWLWSFHSLLPILSSLITLPSSSQLGGFTNVTVDFTCMLPWLTPEFSLCPPSPYFLGASYAASHLRASICRRARAITSWFTFTFPLASRKVSLLPSSAIWRISSASLSARSSRAHAYWSLNST